MWLATLNSLRGLKHCYHSEAAFRQEVWAALVLVPAALWLGQTAVERTLLAGSVLAVVVPFPRQPQLLPPQAARVPSLHIA